MLSIIVSFAADCSNSSDYIGSLPKEDCGTAGHLNKCIHWLTYLPL